MKAETKTEENETSSPSSVMTEEIREDTENSVNELVSAENENNDGNEESEDDTNESADSSDTEASDSEADKNESQSGELSSFKTLKKRKARKSNKLLPKLLIPICAVGLFAGGLAIRAAVPFHAELGQEVEYTFPRFLIDADVSNVDPYTLGEYTMPAKVLSFISTNVKMRVSDTTAPSVTLRELRIMTGQKDVTPEDFVEAFEDEQNISYKFIDPPDFATYSGTCAFEILATDESGNAVHINAYCDLDDSLSNFTFELGTPLDEITDSISKLLNITPDKIEGMSNELGEHSIKAACTDKLTLMTISVVDSIAPTAEPKSTDIILGNRLIGDEIANFVSNVVDESEVFYSYSENEPNWDRAGEQSVAVLLTDAAGNSTEIGSKLYIHNMPSSITVEAGISTSELLELLTAECKDNAPTVIGSYDAAAQPLGAHELKLMGRYSEVSVEVTLIDTVAPQIKMKDFTTDRDMLPSPESFIAKCIDATKVTYEYESVPDVSSTGRVNVTIIAKDAANNTAVGNATLTIIEDLQPPVLYGVKNLYSYEGDTISYRSGVSAIDAVDGRVTVYVDSSKVRTSVAGTYPITYSATDSSGNTASQRAYVIVQQVTQSTLDEYADSILSELITQGMTEREKAKAIYDWCRKTLKYSTVTSHLMGNYYKAAYSGYRLHYGNCYTYYAVSRSLLTRAGITNQMIQRNDPAKPHYWNLVKIDGNWYHFDTCPQPYPNNDGCFLLTDSEVAAYSKKQTGYYSFAQNTYPKAP